ncbi:DUF805 domain-containing protein [Polaribacter septentrionalilitoris]|uniref:DUF805 domain-containing protein n=1 Tax=Polaribacter septentrionalilitoris TaxID=2494657 RepID=UPI001357152B|nr:DUF805 domain-containing protein [Polaribacter septentrionalilitoris]
MNWYLKVLKQYADFSGRARRKEYWMFTLFHVIFTYAFMFLFALIGGALDTPLMLLLMYVYPLAVFIPALAVAVRRLHDTGKSGVYILVGLIPIAGPIWLLVLLCMEGEYKTNQWGKNPKDINSVEIDFIGKE